MHWAQILRISDFYWQGVFFSLLSLTSEKDTITLFSFNKTNYYSTKRIILHSDPVPKFNEVSRWPYSFKVNEQQHQDVHFYRRDSSVRYLHVRTSRIGWSSRHHHPCSLHRWRLPSHPQCRPHPLLRQATQKATRKWVRASVCMKCSGEKKKVLSSLSIHGHSLFLAT